jgi:Sulfotransferase family
MAMTRARNPYVFAVGCPRSGTTLLQRMLDHHPRLGVANDTHFIPHAIDDRSGEIDPPLTPGLVDRVRMYRRFPRLGLSEEVVRAAAQEALTYAQFVSALYDAWGQERGKRLAGEKTPDYVRFLPLLHGLFPFARTVHIIRDGRDVALSALEWATETKGPGKLALWKEEPVAVCALWWRRQVSAGRRDGAQLGPSRYREVRYERLVAEPEAELRGISMFLELPYALEMAAYHVGKMRSQPGLSAKSAWLPPTPGLRDWRSSMAERDVELFEALAGDLLSSLGYERLVPTISSRVEAVAARCRSWWACEFARREDVARAREFVS